MKNFLKLIGIIALVAVIGFGVAACGDSNDDGNKDKDKDKDVSSGSTDDGSSSTDDGSSSTDDAFTGTWISVRPANPNNGDQGGNTKITAANGAWVMSQTESAASQTYYNGIKGTYTMSGNTVNAVMTHITGFMLEQNTAKADQWTAWADLPDEVKTGMGGSQSMQFTITNNQFTANDETFTKQ